jgi:hypothetical protein
MVIRGLIKLKKLSYNKILNWFTINEANLKGTMTFRNWTDSLQEEKKKNKDPFGINQFMLESY